MKRFHSSIQIHATPEVVWKILTDAPGYARWNSTVDHLEGRIALGDKVTVHIKADPNLGKPPRAFPATVSELSIPHSMTWSGGMPLGLFKGVRTFTTKAVSTGSVEFAMTEVFSGLLSPLIERSIPDLQPVFDQFAADLKKAAESST